MTKKFQLAILETQKPHKLSAGARKSPRVTLAKLTTQPKAVYKALTATPGSNKLLEQVPSLKDFTLWQTIASFTACKKTGTARFLDLWDVDHFDFFTDLQQNLTNCRVWFSANGFTEFGSSETKTGRINCFFTVPTSGTYICNADLQSFGGTAVVQCLIDSSSFGNLTVNGSITQPHTSNLAAGGHHFRIRQISGSFFFIGLTVWKV